MYTLGIDLGSSSVKASLLNLTDGSCKASAFYPKEEMAMIAAQKGWAEQEPTVWWANLRNALNDVLKTAGMNAKEIKAIGIAHPMPGPVALHRNGEVLGPSTISSDSRAVGIGENAFKELGAQYCLTSLLTSPGNFTASRLKWVKANEPQKNAKFYKIMLPGDYI